MSAQAFAQSSAPQTTALHRIATVGLALTLGFAIVLAGAWQGGHWLNDSQGQPIANDFVDVWAAGDLALHGHAAAAYDWTLHKAAEVQAVGHGFDNYYGWHYPPTYFFIAAALALLPYAAAALIWLALSLPVYAATVRGIIGERSAVWIALGSPAVLWNITAGQNGFLTAALIGGALRFLPRQPWLAGACLGLLTYKPHFGLLFPVALIAGRCWRAIGAACAVAVLMAALSLLAFGVDSWQAFFHWLPITGNAVLGQGDADWSRLQSLYGLLRALGADADAALAGQAVLSLSLAATVAWLWRGRVDYELKAAALACAALLATPYLYIYDLVTLTIPAAFVLRLAARRGFLAGEITALAAAVLLLLSYPYLKTQVGFAAVALIAALVVRRVMAGTTAAPRIAPSSQSC